MNLISKVVNVRRTLIHYNALKNVHVEIKSNNKKVHFVNPNLNVESDANAHS